jgi:hypothetical protein
VPGFRPGVKSTFGTAPICKIWLHLRHGLVISTPGKEFHTLRQIDVQSLDIVQFGKLPEKCLFKVISGLMAVCSFIVKILVTMIDDTVAGGWA